MFASLLVYATIRASPKGDDMITGSMSDALFPPGAVRFDSLKEGDTEPTLGKVIDCLIVKTRTYIVYLDEERFVQWSTNEHARWCEGHGEILTRVSQLEAFPVDHLKPSHVFAFRRMIGESVGRVLDSADATEAKAALDLAESFVKARSDEVARKWYLTASLAGGGALAVLIVVWWMSRGWLSTSIGPGAFQVALGAMLGGIGAMLSVLTRSNRLTLDSAAGAALHYFEGGSRIATGAVGGLLVGLAVKANLILGFVSDSPHSLAVLSTICLAAGASERMVPGFIDKIELLPRS